MAEQFVLGIDSLAFGGAGVGHHEGKVVFVPGAFPGDTVLARVEKEHKRFVEASVAAVESPSSLRRPPACPYVDDCGGCPWMPLAYPAQLEWKRKIIAEQFAHIGKMAVEVAPAAASPVELGYRARVRLKASFAGGNFTIGFCRPKTHHVVPVERCAVANEKINAMIPELRRFFADRPECAPHLKAVKLETGHPAPEGRVTLEADGDIPGKFLERLLASCPSVKGASARFGRNERHRGDGMLSLAIADGISLDYGPGVFSQINPLANLALLEKAVAAAGLSPGETGLDLYCGVGNITFPLANAGVAMAGVEFSRAAVDDAEKNKTRLGLSAVSFLQGDAGKHARQMERDGQRFDTVLLDPPRGGAPGLAPTLCALARKRVVYISCYPPALARDAAEMVKHGFRLAQVSPVDMFPHTAHVESVALFERG